MTRVEGWRVHSSRRAWQRHGLAIGKPELAKAESQIWGGFAEWIADRPNMRSVYFVKIKRRKVPVIFNVRSGTIVTILPRGVREIVRA